MQKLGSILINEMHEILYDFEIQTDPFIPPRRPDLALIHKKKRICCLVEIAVLAERIEKIKESKKIGKYLLDMNYS